MVWDNFAVQHGRPNVTLEGPARTLRKIGLPMAKDKATQQVVSYQKVS